MALMKTEYEFLDLSDVKEAELSSLQCALFERQTVNSDVALNVNWSETIHLSSCSSSTAGAATVSSSLDSLSGGECEMAPHSPQRGAGAGTTAGSGGSGAAAVPSVPAPAPHVPPPPYVQPPPPYGPPAHQQWPVAPPNVYVSQVTANVNVHGYMGQYYQPQPQFPPHPPPGDRPPRNHRRDRRQKRVPSPPLPAAQPPAQPPPYYVQYPPYYSAAQAQGAPLYHLPVYQPVTYVGHYPYQTYYPEYPVSVEGDADKPPDEYPPEVLMEQEAVDAYYGAHYGPPYGPSADVPLEYLPQVYVPHPHPHHHHPPPVTPVAPAPHQFNVHAKNFVQNQSHPPPPVVDQLPVRDLRITAKEPGSPEMERPVERAPTEPSTSQTEKVSPTIKPDVPKPAWTTAEVKTTESAPSPQPPTPTVKTFTQSAPTPAQPAQPASAPKSAAPAIVKMIKGPAAPFSGNKQTPKPSIPPASVPVQHNVSGPKAPFANRQKREGANARSPSHELSENTTTEKPAAPAEHTRREQPLPPSKAPMPISITLHSQGQPSIVSNKPPFGHSRKSVPVQETPPVPQPPPPAPTASDFPPPPTPRNRGEPVPPPVVQQPTPPAPGKSWASLFSNKSATIQASSHLDEPASPTIAAPPVVNIQKPVAKVPPFDASPLLQSAPVEKSSPAPKTNATTTISYSEKTSVNAVNNSSVVPAVKSVSPTSEVHEHLPQKEVTPAPPVQPSPFADDPNSYRMGEFLAKYQLDNKPVAISPRGLTNRSNYCYVNAILQALIACPPFYNMLKALPYQTRRGKSSTPVIDAMVELCYEFTPLMPSVRVSRSRGGESAAGALPVQMGPPLDPSAGQKVLRALRPFPGSQEGRQEDAEEFLGCLLNGLNDEMLELIKLVEPEETKDAQTNGIVVQEQPLEEEDDDEWKVMGPRNKGAIERRWAAGRSPLSDIFRGRTRCRTHRAHTHDVADAVQPFFTLQLDMERASNVKDALELLAGKDTLEGVGDAWQQLSIEQLPVVLLLHLKCFQLDPEGHTAKIVKNVDFPIDLKIDPKIMSSKLKYTSKQRMYKLFAVVYHEGVEAVKGHYLTDTYHGQAGWIRYDDSTVTLVNDAQVLKPKPPRMPYLLMYRRQDTLPVPHRPGQKTE